jgi:hypothetical protein
MEVLRNLFGNVTSGIIRLAVIVGIFAAAYFFFVKPTLDTVDKGFQLGESLQQTGVENTLRRSGVNVHAINRTLRQANKHTQITITRSFHIAKHQGIGDVKRLGNCMAHAAGNIAKVQRCASRFG